MHSVTFETKKKEKEKYSERCFLEEPGRWNTCGASASSPSTTVKRQQKKPS